MESEDNGEIDEAELNQEPQASTPLPPSTSGTAPGMCVICYDFPKTNETGNLCTGCFDIMSTIDSEEPEFQSPMPSSDPDADTGVIPAFGLMM